MGLFDFTATAVTSKGLVKRMSEANGWSLDQEDGVASALHFSGDHISQWRAVIIGHEEGDRLVYFASSCRAVFSSGNLPADLLPALMVRNDGLAFGGWAAEVKDGRVKLTMKYSALATGLDAAKFKLICAFLLKEVAEIEVSLRNKGLL